MSTEESKVGRKRGFFSTAGSYITGKIWKPTNKATTLGDVFNALPTEPMSPKYRVHVIDTAILKQFLSVPELEFIDETIGNNREKINGLMFFDSNEIDTLILSSQGISAVNKSKIKKMLMNESSPILSMISMFKNMSRDIYQKVKAKVLPTQTSPPDYSARVIEIAKIKEILSEEEFPGYLSIMKDIQAQKINGLMFFDIDKMNQLNPKETDLLKKITNNSFSILSIISMVQDMEPVGFLASNGQIEWANIAALDALGMTLDELIGKNILDVTHNYGLSEVRKNQIQNEDFNPYKAIFYNEKTKTEIPVRIQPGPIDGKRTFGIITILKPGNSLFSEKDQQREYVEELQTSFGRIREEFKNSRQAPLTLPVILDRVKDFSGSDTAFLASKATGGYDVRITGKDNTITKEMESLLTYFENNPFLYFSEIAHPLKKHIEDFLPRSGEITSGFLVPIRNEKGETTDIIGVTSNDKPLFPNINPSVVSVWFQYFGEISQNIRLSK